MITPYTSSAGWKLMGTKWGSPTAYSTPGGSITWSFADTSLATGLSQSYLGYPDITQELAPSERDAVRQAFATWESYANLHFIEIPDSASAAIRIGIASIDGKNGTLATTTVWGSPYLQKAALVFDSADLQTLTATSTTANGFLSTATHEIGHTIGLDHSSDADALMYGYYHDIATLDPNDIEAVQYLYGKNQLNTTAATLHTTPITFSADQDSTEAFVVRLYHAALDRYPDQGGKAYWVSQLHNGATREQIADTLYRCIPTLQSQSDEQFVDTLYTNTLGRSGTTTEVAPWTALLQNGSSRADLLLSFAASQEIIGKSVSEIYASENIAIASSSGNATDFAIEQYSLEAFVTRLYYAGLGRAPDKDGKDYWISTIVSGANDLEGVAQIFYAVSPEFHDPQGGYLGDAAFVGALYENVFGTAAPEASVASLVNSLENGLSHEKMLLAFSENPSNITQAASYVAWTGNLTVPTNSGDLAQLIGLPSDTADIAFG